MHRTNGRARPGALFAVGCLRAAAAVVLAWRWLMATLSTSGHLGPALAPGTLDGRPGYATLEQDGVVWSGDLPPRRRSRDGGGALGSGNMDESRAQGDDSSKVIGRYRKGHPRITSRYWWPTGAANLARA